MSTVRKLALAASFAAVFTVGAAALAAPDPQRVGSPPGQENCTRPCARWKVFNGMKCKFVGCDIEGICRYLC
jgi:hypothetical protein